MTAIHDPISDLLTRIRNAVMAEHRFVDLYSSKMILSIVKVLKEQGFIENYLVDEKQRKLRILFKYSSKRTPVIQGLKRVSSPGLKRYVKHQEIPRVLSGMGIAILSTSQGICEGEAARKQRLGGELLCLIW